MRFSLAGFQVIIIGRFWVITEDAARSASPAVTNASAEPFGERPSYGTLTIHYFGGTYGGGSAPPPQTSTVVAPGEVASFTLSGGGSHGIAATPMFSGYLVVECRFPDAHGLALISDMGNQKAATSYVAKTL